MEPPRKFADQWEPHLLEEQVLAKGTWWYDGIVPYTAVLKRQRFDYTSEDLDYLETHLDPITFDYIDYAISPSGDLYTWFFTGPTGSTVSPSFSTLAEAKSHIASYGRSEIRWHSEGAA